MILSTLRPMGLAKPTGALGDLADGGLVGHFDIGGAQDGAELHVVQFPVAAHQASHGLAVGPILTKRSGYEVHSYYTYEEASAHVADDDAFVDLRYYVG